MLLDQIKLNTRFEQGPGIPWIFLWGYSVHKVFCQHLALLPVADSGWTKRLLWHRFAFQKATVPDICVALSLALSSLKIPAKGSAFRRAWAGVALGRHAISCNQLGRWRRFGVWSPCPARWDSKRDKLWQAHSGIAHHSAVYRWCRRVAQNLGCPSWWWPAMPLVTQCHLVPLGMSKMGQVVHQLTIDIYIYINIYIIIYIDIYWYILIYIDSAVAIGCRWFKTSRRGISDASESIFMMSAW